MSNQIRNVAQSCQEREIIKTAPDVVVYIEGRPYLINPYINTKDSKSQSTGLFTVVNFNDYLDSFSVSYDVDNLKPQGSFTLSIPESQKYLFQAPGGNNIIETMMPVQVFSKGYFPSKDGNTLYYRVFKGLISNVTHTDTGTALQIAVTIVGALHLLDLMYIDIAPALLSNAANPVVAYASDQYGMTPYTALADTFLRAVTCAGFQLVSIDQAKLNKDSDWTETVNQDFISRWQTILTNIMRDVRILGLDLKDLTANYNPGTYPDTLSKQQDDTLGQMIPAIRVARASRVGQKSISDAVSDPNLFIPILRQYHPDAAIKNISLFTGKIVSRLERLRVLSDLIAYEGYQDLDGAVIFKPPFYNLDVTNLGALAQGTNASGTAGATSSSSYIRKGANPFIVYLAEIESEAETEDEAGIRATRVVCQSDWVPYFHWSSPNTILPAADHIDIAKMAKFGLREQPAKQLPFIGQGDKMMLYTYAVSELNRMNRSYRTYTFTIPIRPEIRLGFPMYIPHRDMYGYIKTVNIAYQQGGNATMSITLDTLRKRPMLPADTSIQGTDGKPRNIITYRSQPNLVMQWTTPPASDVNSANPFSTPDYLTSAAYGGSGSSGSSGMSSEGSNNTPLLILRPGDPMTVTQPQSTPVYSQEWEYIMHQKEKLGSLYQVRFDTRAKSFRVQNDNVTAEDLSLVGAQSFKGTALQLDKPFFRGDVWTDPLNEGINTVYYNKILTTQPYTDEKGYELITPFPWGRWIDVNTAIRESRLGILTDNPNPQGAATVQAMNVFLFAGLSTPQTSGDIAGSMSDTLNSQFTGTINGVPLSGFDSVELDSVIELVTPQPGSVSNDQELTNISQPDMQNQASVAALNDISSRLGFFITGGSTLPDTQSFNGAMNLPVPGPSAPAAPDTLASTVPGGGPSATQVL